MQKALYGLYNNHRYKFINTYFFQNGGESDWLSFLPSGYSYEVEIKRTKSDFRADFRKFKHKLFKSLRNGHRYTVKRGQTTNGYSVIRYYRDQKDGPIKVKQTYTTKGYSSIRIIDNKDIPNRFFFGVPEGLIDVKDVPEYAGLIYIGDYSSKIIKTAPLLHREKHNPNRIFKKMYRSYEASLYQSLIEI